MPSSRPGTIARGWDLARTAWDLARSDRTVLAAAAAGGLAVAAVSAARGLSGWPSQPHQVTRALLLIVFAWPFVFGTTLSGVAVATAATAALDGRPASAREAFGAAGRRLRQILMWSLLGAGVSVVTNAIATFVPSGWRFLADVVEVPWVAVVFFAVPVLAVEGLGPLATVRRAVRLIQSRWGEGVAGIVGICAWALVLFLPGSILIGAGRGSTDGGSASTRFAPSVVAGVALLVVAVILVVATIQVFAAVVYRSTETETANRR